MIKVLVITYYWPPSGGAGVQRWLKLTKYLAELGAEVHVLSVDPAKASYLHLDKSLEQDISQSQGSPDQLLRTNKLLRQSCREENVPTAGFSNVNKYSSLVNKTWSTAFARTSLFLTRAMAGIPMH
ncbi:MAG: hypothetical protein R3B47_01315 [Bacteroidia bacterium]